MLGTTQGEILLLLSTVDDIVISMHTLRRILKCMGLYSRKNQFDHLEVASFLNDHLEGYGRRHGDKLHHLTVFLQYNITFLQ